MWGIVNKDVCEDDVMAAVEEAFRTGRTTLKLYFMIGFPLEEDADVEGIADLCLKIREKGREMLGDRRNRLQLNISVNNFIPKSFTPFQWAGMADRVTLRRRQELLRERLRRPGIRLSLHSVDRSYLEAALARGGIEMAGIIEEAWRAGARFDNWTEQFSNAAWGRAFEAAGTTAEAGGYDELPTRGGAALGCGFGCRSTATSCGRSGRKRRRGRRPPTAAGMPAVSAGPATAGPRSRPAPQVGSPAGGAEARDGAADSTTDREPAAREAATPLRAGGPSALALCGHLLCHRPGALHRPSRP